MAKIEFSAIKCNRIYEKAVKVTSPTLKHIGLPVRIVIETTSEPTSEYISSTVKLIEETPVTQFEYFVDVRYVEAIEE